MDSIAKAGIGRTDLRVSRLGFGGVPLGGLYKDVAEDEAGATVRRALELGIQYFDTAPIYGFGKSEIRLGRELAACNRDSLVVATKVGYTLLSETGGRDDKVFHRFANVPPMHPVFDFSYDGIMRTFEESLKRLNLERVDILNIHDPDEHWEEAIGIVYPALHRLRSDGVVRAIGVGMNQAEMLTRFVRETDIDVVLVAGRYTLLDQTAADTLLPAALERSVSVIAGGVFNSGVLAAPTPDATYDYAAAPGSLISRALRLQEICAQAGVPLRAAAARFPLAHPAVASVLIGARNAAEVTDAITLRGLDIRPELWESLATAQEKGRA